MNRKLVNGLLLLTLASGGCGMFTSCKDTDDDFRNEIVSGQVSLADRIKKLEDYTGILNDQITPALKDRIKANENEIGRLRGLLEGENGVADQIDDVKSQITNLLAENAKLTGDIATINSTLASLQSQIDNFQSADVDKAYVDNAIQTLQTALEQEITNLNTTLTSLSTTVTGIEGDVNTLKGDLTTVKTDVSTLQTNLSQLQTNFDADHIKLIQALVDIQTQGAELEALNETLDGVAETANQNWQVLFGKGGLVSTVNTLMEKVANNEEDITAIQDELYRYQGQIQQLQSLTAYYFSSINERLNSLITDIFVNQVWNPMFGTINLPLGVNSTIAANYYGYSDHALNFPLDPYSSRYEVLGANSGTAILGETLAGNLKNDLNGEQEIINANKRYMNESENNLGQAYISINPNTVNWDGKELALVSSDGKEAPVKVKVAATDEKLTWGANVTRSVDNGFYRANMSISAEDAAAISVRVEDGLKSAMQDALKGHTKSDFIALGKAVFNQMKDVAPAYALKATWTTPSTEFPNGNVSEPVEHQYIGKYDIMATAIRPLGYDFLHGQGANSDVLPTIGSIQEVFNNFFDDLELDIKIDFKDIEHLNIKGLNVKIDIADIDLGNPEIIIDLSGIEVEGEKAIGVDEHGNMQYQWGIIGTVPEGTEIKLTYDPTLDKPIQGEGALNEFIDNIQGQINDMLKDINGQINEDLIKEVNDLIETQIQGQVNDMLDDINEQLQGINGQITDSIEKIKDQIKNSISGKLGKLDNLVDKYNALAQRVNDFLKDPNQYLQVTMAYQDGKNSLHMVSSDINYPSVFNQAGGNALKLYATSYTAELIAPSYKKYVAVSRVWDSLGNEVAYAGANGAKEVNAANKDHYLNAVRPGNQQIFLIDANTLQKGYKYEVVYSSLDYQGFTSTRLFYFVVK